MSSTMKKTNPVVYMDVNIGLQKAGRMIFEIFADTTPRTAANFVALCTLLAPLVDLITITSDSITYAAFLFL